jgi:hypothetical protein
MKRFLTASAIIAALALSAAAQDWYHEREERFRGEQWRPRIFLHVRTDLEHVWSGQAADRERRRLVKTEEELTKMQADLDQGRFDNGILNDVIDSIRKSSNDERLAPRDRAILAEDLVHLKDYQDHHNHWH